MSRILFLITVAAVTVWSFLLPDAAVFQRTNMAKILIWHLPCPMLAISLLAIGAWFSFQVVRKKSMDYDLRAIACMELGYLFCLLTMGTGIVFSEVQWGSWWSSDPRQTSFLMVLLIYAAYFALRGALQDERKRAANSAIYALAAILPVLFLTFVFPRLPQMQGLHPNDTITGGNLKGQYLWASMASSVVMTVLATWLYRIRVRTGQLETFLEDKNNGYQIPAGDPAATGVVRPVRLPREG
jgi:heme exporter protein C